MRTRRSDRTIAVLSWIFAVQLTELPDGPLTPQEIAEVVAASELAQRFVEYIREDDVDGEQIEFPMPGVSRRMRKAASYTVYVRERRGGSEKFQIDCTQVRAAKSREQARALILGALKPKETCDKPTR